MDVLGMERIHQTLPHRYPFLLIDRILERERGHVVALKNVSIDEPFFQGHFPPPLGPVMPGVLLIEAMAQATAFLVPCSGAGGETRTGYLVGVDKARFRRQVVPGDQLRLAATLVRNRARLLRADVEATVEGEMVASATITVAVPHLSQDRL